MATFDRQLFLTAFAKGFGKTTAQQRDGLDFLLGKVETDEAWGKTLDLRMVAYFLATIKWETNHKFQPIQEYRSRVGSKGRANQDRYWLSGFYGRGYVQITWKKNYEKFGIAGDPEKALEPETAYRIASQGMLKGMFTGHKLANYVDDFVGARTIINGTNEAVAIASIARKMQACLSLSLVKEPTKTTEEVEPTETAAVPSPPEPQEGAPSPSSSLADKARSAMDAYKGADESIKSLAGRVLQGAWTGIAGLVAIVQNNPVKTAIAVLVLILGFLVLHFYTKRQDTKSFIKAGKQ